MAQELVDLIGLVECRPKLAKRGDKRMVHLLHLELPRAVLMPGMPFEESAERLLQNLGVLKGVQSGVENGDALALRKEVRQRHSYTRGVRLGDPGRVVEYQRVKGGKIRGIAQASGFIAEKEGGMQAANVVKL